jgi:hypothetical protein
MITKEQSRIFFSSTKQCSNESFNDFITRLRKQVVSCHFDEPDEQIKAQIIGHCQSKKLREMALEKEMTLNQIIDLGRKLELEYLNIICNRCGTPGHSYKNPRCPALGANCIHCKKSGHYSTMCRTFPSNPNLVPLKRASEFVEVQVKRTRFSDRETNSTNNGADQISSSQAVKVPTQANDLTRNQNTTPKKSAESVLSHKSMSHTPSKNQQ